VISARMVDKSLARLNLVAIENSLREVQAEFPRIKRYLRTDRDQMDDEVVENLLSGYALIDELIACQTRLLTFGNLKYCLELNYTVLCGPQGTRRERYANYLEATERHFYDHREGGIRDVMEWYALHRNEAVWARAAGVYMRILGEPQLFIEGNHRSGTLVMSYLLVSEGCPPFVLTAENAEIYFDLSSRMTQLRKKSVEMALLASMLKNRFADFLKTNTRETYLS
jgi:hypothetical protein